MDLLHHLEKGKEELSPLQYHIKSLHIISRHYKKSLLRSQIYHGYEELSMDTNYPIWRRQERRSKYAVQLASWQLRWNSPKTSVCLSVRPSVRPSITRQKLHINRSVVLGELMSRPDPVILPVGTLHSLESFWVSRRIFIYSHHNTYVFSLRRLSRIPCPLCSIYSSEWILSIFGTND